MTVCKTALTWTTSLLRSSWIARMLTSEEGVDKETEALAVGVDDYIVKPVEPRRLAARVKSVLTRTKQRREAVAR